MKKRIVSLLLVTAALILEILPYGAVCNFMKDGGETIRKTYSYFSPVPYGYANFGPLVTAVLTVIMLVLSVILLIKDVKRLRDIRRVMSCFALFASVLPLTLGFHFWSAAGIGITLLLSALVAILLRREKDDRI